MDCRDDHMFSLLHWAAKEGHLNIAEMLLSRGARVNATNMGDDTALHLAAAHGHRPLVQVTNMICLAISLSICLPRTGLTTTFFSSILPPTAFLSCSTSYKTFAFRNYCLEKQTWMPSTSTETHRCIIRVFGVMNKSARYIIVNIFLIKCINGTLGF